MTKNIFLVEDNAEMRMAYELLIEEEPGLALCGMAATGQEALSALPATAPDIAIVDISLPDMSGIELVSQLKSQHPNLHILVISGHAEALYVRDAVEAGARGYLIKHEVVAKLSEAVYRVLDGDEYISEHLRAHLV